MGLVGPRVHAAIVRLVFMLKAVLDGRASELIDLAKVNLTR